MVSLLWSCSTKKNTRFNRFYHALNSRFNIYYNGKTSFDEALLSMQTGYKENYSDMILMYPISAQPKEKAETGGPFDRAIEKSNKAIKLHSIKTKPKKKAGWRKDPKQVTWQNQEEYNPFLKKCWMLMGEAQFYNADFLQASATSLILPAIIRKMKNWLLQPNSGRLVVMPRWVGIMRQKIFWGN